MTTSSTKESNWFDINYVEQNAYRTHFVPLLNNKRVLNYCEKHVSRFLSHIGFSQLFYESLLSNFAHLNFDTFHQEFDVEIRKVYNNNMMQVIAGRYFAENVIPSIPMSKLVLDVGCGTGTLVRELANSHKFSKVMGCDYNSCPEWKNIVENDNTTEFHVVKEDTFPSFIKRNNPDALVFTFVLHHMELSIQYNYIKNLFDMMRSGAILVIIEDTYSTILVPEFGQNEQQEFMNFSEQDKRDVLTIHDWISNIFLERRAMPIPSTYRTLEGWENFFSEIGFNIMSKRFIGWPTKDFISPQGLLVLMKPDTDVELASD